MDDLMAFLWARLDEEEATARSAQSRVPGPWGSESLLAAWSDSEQITDAEGAPVSTVHAAETREFLLRHHPARVLREIDAKRQIVNAHSRGHECIELTDGRPWELWEPQHTSDHGPCFVLRALALPYAHHADCREEWRP